MEGEDAVEIAQFEHSPHPRLRDDQLEITVEQPYPLERANEHAETKRVDEVDSRQIEDEVVQAVGYRVHHVLSEFGCAHDIEFASHGEHQPLTISVSVGDDVHSLHGIGPHPCDSVTVGP